MHNYRIEEIVEALLADELVALPTETVYGLAANALRSAAVQKIFEVKGRPLIDPLIVHTYAISEVEKLAIVPEIAYKLAEVFWPGPLTLVLKKKAIIPDIVTANLPSVGIRLPKHPIFREILIKSNLPLAAPSANPFGYLSPTEARHVEKTLGKKIKYIVDGGPCALGLESTILNVLNPEEPEILRPGPITAEDLDYVFGFKPRYLSRSYDEGAQISPGLLKSHYSPRTPLKIFHSLSEITPLEEMNEKSALIFIKRPAKIKKSYNVEVFWLSENGDLKEVSRNLFSLLEKLDNQELRDIFVELPEKKGIGIAICNRLERAAQKG